MHATGEKTKQRLKDAFWKEYEQHPIEKISVRMIVDDAGLHRSTFYLHYQDVYQVLDEIEAELVVLITALPIANEVSDTTVTKFALGLRDLCDTHQPIVQELLVKQRDYRFAQQVQSILHRQVQQLFDLPDTTQMSSGQVFAVEGTIQLIITLFMQWAATDVDFKVLMRLTHGLMAQGMLITLTHDFGID